MEWNNWIERWQITLDAVKKLGGTTSGLELLGKANEDEVKEVERELGIKLPESLRGVLLNFSKSVDFSWRLPKDFNMPEELKDIWAGECRWSLEEIVGVDKGKEVWIESCFSNIDDPYDKVWHNKLAFFHISNGDCLAMDLASPGKEAVLYLSHDGAEEHGYVLGENFEDFIDRWIRIGCVGAECWQLAPFIDSPIEGLNPDSKNAIGLRRLLGVRF